MPKIAPVGGLGLVPVGVSVGVPVGASAGVPKRAPDVVRDIAGSCARAIALPIEPHLSPYCGKFWTALFLSWIPLLEPDEPDAFLTF